MERFKLLHLALPEEKGLRKYIDIHFLLMSWLDGRKQKRKNLIFLRVNQGMAYE